MPVAGKVVVDIGAALGDTAIYFAMRGAKRVHGYELNKRCFDVAQKNIDLNGLRNVVDIEYCGIAAKKITSDTRVLGAIMPNDDAVQVGGAGFKTLDSIAVENNLSDAVLKIDVDGFEYEIMDSVTRDTLRRFELIFMEYHFGIQKLEQTLSDAGFQVFITEGAKVRIDEHPIEFKDMDIGFLMAKRLAT